MPYSICLVNISRPPYKSLRSHGLTLLIQASYVCNFILLFAIRWLLNKENHRRDALQAKYPVETNGYVERLDSDGQRYRQKVDKGLLDMTDRQNASFRYSL